MRTAVVMSLLALLGCGGAVTGPEELVPGPADGGARFDDEPDATPIGRVLPPETCGNGLDDNGNGFIDEGCSCKVNATQACWPGDPKMRHVGQCRDGVQTCSADDVEFPKWSACVGAVTDCGPICTPKPEVCNDGVDNDCDGKIDCDDPDCASAPNCQKCVKQLDWEYCGDGIDNDCNGLTDCDDPQCQATAFCTCTAETCDPGTTRWCDGPQYCDWGQQTCGPDHKWGTCREVNQHPAGCNPSLYNEVCCENAGGCCEGVFDHASYGNCPGVVKTCHPS